MVVGLAALAAIVLSLGFALLASVMGDLTSDPAHSLELGAGIRSSSAL